jgi:hypothetical protein
MRKQEKPQIGVVYNTFFVHYDQEGNVHLLSNIKDEQYKIFEIDLFLVDDFLKGKKDYKKYNIEYFYNLSKGVITDEQDNIEYSKPLFQILPLVDTYDNNITVEHDAVSKQWTIFADEDALDKLSVLPGLSFYVSKKNDPHFLYRSFTVKSEELEHGPVTCKFATDNELDLTSISIATLKRFEKYGVTEKNDQQD